MKTTKASKTNTRSRIIFFAIALTYNLSLGIYPEELCRTKLEYFMSALKNGQLVIPKGIQYKYTRKRNTDG